MSMKINMNLQAFKAQLAATAAELGRATRPASQAGAQIIYDRAKSIASGIKSKKAHKFYGTNKVYGPFQPGALQNAIYQVFSKDNSYSDVSTYHISWNADEAPYGGMVEFGTSRAPAQSFIGRSVKETRSAVREAIKARFIAEMGAK